jgi:hypothetical protein
MGDVRLSREEKVRAAELGAAIVEINGDIRNASALDTKTNLLHKRQEMQAELDSILPLAAEPLHRLLTQRSV